MMKKILIGTNNKGKVKEYSALLGNYFDILTPHDLDIEFNVDETGKSYEENSLLKLEFLRKKQPNIPILCDDSGLEIKSLNNEPGIFSARYAGKGSGDKENIDKVLLNLKGIKEREAKFVCLISFFSKEFSPYPQIFRGECFGTIIEKPDGKSGFGYDPIFYYEKLHKTFANLLEHEKNLISHRALAVEKFLKEVIFNL